MSKSKLRIKDAAKEYGDELQSKFPFIDVKPIFDPFYGYDFTVDVLVPPDHADAFDDVQLATIELNWRLWDDEGIAATALVMEEEPVHG